MEKRMELNLLLDFYGPLLTGTRARMLSLYCEEDMSFGEIADALGVTRQAAHDAVSRATEQLEEYERKLGLVRRYRRIRAEIGAARAALEDERALEAPRDALDRAVEALKKIEWMDEG